MAAPMRPAQRAAVLPRAGLPREARLTGPSASNGPLGGGSRRSETHLSPDDYSVLGGKSEHPQRARGLRPPLHGSRASRARAVFSTSVFFLKILQWPSWHTNNARKGFRAFGQLYGWSTVHVRMKVDDVL
jgi:hypothetical protein